MKRTITDQRSQPDLRKGYFVRFEIGLISSLLIMILLFKMNIRLPETNNDYQVYAQEEVQIEDIIQTKQVTQPPLPPKPLVPVEVPNYEVLDIEILNIDAELKLDEPLAVPALPPKAIESQEKALQDEIFIAVEQPPELIGGIKELQSHIIYPKKALMANVEGLVVIQFIVDPEGNVKDLVVVRGIGAGCDEEAIRVIKLAKFKPGKQRGIAVSVQFAVPINFRIRENI